MFDLQHGHCRRISSAGGVSLLIKLCIALITIRSPGPGCKLWTLEDDILHLSLFADTRRGISTVEQKEL